MKNIVIGLVTLTVLMLNGCGPLVDYYAFEPAAEPTAIDAESAAVRKAEPVSITTSDGETLQALYFGHGESDYVTLYLTGNAGHIYGHADVAQKLAEQSKGDVLLLSYRGFGDSTGSPSERGIYLDTQAALEYLVEAGFRKDKIIIYGYSMGCAAAIEIAQYDELAGLILVAGFTNINEFIQDWGYESWGWVGLYKFDSLDKAPAVTEKALWIHGTEDGIVPYHRGLAVYNALGSKDKSMLTLDGANHNSFAWTHAASFWLAIAQFYAKGIAAE